LTLLFLTMGLATTVIVAMFLALLVDVEDAAAARQQSQSTYLSEDDQLWSVTRWDRNGAARIRSERSRAGASWGAQQAAGPPDTPTLGDIGTAWASRTPDAQGEWLIADYADAVVPRRVDVYESYSPGALNRVTVFDDAGAEHEAWHGVDPTKPNNPTVGVSQVPVTLNVKTRRVKIYLASDQVPGWNEIDAIGLVGDDGRVQWAKRITASTTYASGGYGATGGDPATLTPEWSALDRPTAALAGGAIVREVRQVDARGWPMLALWSSADASPAMSGSTTAVPSSPAPQPQIQSGRGAGLTPGTTSFIPAAPGSSGPYSGSPPATYTTSVGLLSPPPPTVAADRPIAVGVPLRPIWPGLAVDTGFYAAIWAGLWGALLVPRRFIREVARFRRGACIACGYDLGYEFVRGCPECGWRRERADRPNAGGGTDATAGSERDRR
jgi:hypothetical protein